MTIGAPQASRDPDGGWHSVRLPRTLAAVMSRARQAALIAVLAVALHPVVVAARGGGGGHGGGGGGGGSAGAGFGGGGAGVGGVAAAGLIVVFVVVGAVVWYGFIEPLLRRGAPGDESFAVHEDMPAASPSSPQDADALAGVAAIRAADPDFEPESFLQRSELCFMLVQRAYQDLDAGSATPYLDADQHAALDARIERLRSAHERPLLENLNVRGLQLTQVRIDRDWQQVTIHIDYVAAERVVDEATLHNVRGETSDRRHGSDWTFSRRAGARTPASGGTTAGHCPGCQAAQTDMRSTHCAFCGADFTSGTYDWVVSAMVTSSFVGAPVLTTAFGGAQLGRKAGLAAIAADDPAFDEVEFLDRARTAFMTLQHAWQERDVEPARAFMSPGLYLGWSSQVRQLVDLHKRNLLDGLRIETVRIVRVVHGGATDDVTVRFAAESADYEVDDRSGRKVFGSRRISEWVEYWTFQRSRGVKTAASGIADKVCPNCGAPLSINQIGDCAYCGAAVTSGRFDWVLSRIEQEEEWAAA
jgi:predicted lipid-binding transport protein (Tim44 family)